MRTTALSGQVHLDGRASVIEISLHELSSDQTYRDQYVRQVMFPDTPTATFTVPDVGQIPDGLASGEEVTTQMSGSLEIGDVTVPLEFEIEARDDGDRMFIIGRTTFTWDQLGMPPPSSRGVASIDDEVRVEVLLRVFPEQG
jgi:polyisoprenoid-binding protein YceI